MTPHNSLTTIYATYFSWSATTGWKQYQDFIPVLKGNNSEEVVSVSRLANVTFQTLHTTKGRVINIVLPAALHKPSRFNLRWNESGCQGVTTLIRTPWQHWQHAELTCIYHLWCLLFLPLFGCAPGFFVFWSFFMYGSVQSSSVQPVRLLVNLLPFYCVVGLLDSYLTQFQLVTGVFHSIECSPPHTGFPIHL